MKDRFTKWILRQIFGRFTGTHCCANRVEWTYVKKFHDQEIEYRIIRRNTSVPDTYSREERYGMAQILRREYARDGWDVFSCFDSPTSVE